MKRKKQHNIFQALLLLSLLSSSVAVFKTLPVAAQEKPGRLLAAQFLWIQDSNFKQLEQTFIRLKQAGVNTIILRVFQNIGDRPHKLAKVKARTGVYFNTRHAPLVDDLLTPISELAHKHGFKLFALMTTLRCDWKITQEPELQGSGYDLGNNIIYKTDELDPFKRPVRYYLADLYRDLAACNIDGIMFQDDLVLRNTEGFSREAQAAFQRDNGVKLVPSEFYKGISKRDGKYVATGYSKKFWQWSRWKNKRLLELAKNLMANARRVKPQIKFALNLYYETVVEPDNALAWLSQDLKAALNYDFDYYALMAYHRQLQRERGLTPKLALKVFREMVQEMLRIVGNANKVWLKFQVKDWKSGQNIPTPELEQILQIMSKIEGVNLAYVPQEGQAPLELIKNYYK